MAVDFAAWLKDPAAVRIVLIEVGVKSGGSETTRFLSTGAYVTSPSDSPANTQYLPVVTAGINFTEQLDLTTGGASLSGGDIEVANYNGERDSWLDDVWDNRNVKAWIGDPRWVRADFQLIFNGVVATIDSKDRGTLSLSLRDKLQRLNTPITDAKVGGTGASKDDVLNLTFGEVFNVTPKLTNAVTLEYQVHDTAIEDIIEVRDNGKPVSVTKNLAAGRFTLVRPAAGAITCSVQGDKGSGTYLTKIADLVYQIVTAYGQTDQRFTSADIDVANFAAFNGTCAQPVGAFAEGRTNVLQLCQQLASSVDGQLVMSRYGQLRLIQLKAIGNGTPVVVMPHQMVERSLKIVSRPYVRASVMLGFDKNYTVQTDLLTSIPDEHKKFYADEWLTTTKTAGSVKTDYKLNSAPVQIDTCLLTRADADTEAQRRLDMWSVPRTVFSFEGTSDLLQTLELGNAITIKNRRFGLVNGKTGIVVSLAPNWLNGHVTVGVLV